MRPLLSLSLALLLATHLFAAETKTKTPEAKKSKAATATATAAELIQVPPGFKIERLYSVPLDTEGSWINLTNDPQGRLIIASETGDLFRVTPPPVGQSGEPKVEKVVEDFGVCHGLLYAFDSLYVMANDGDRGRSKSKRAARPSGLYRLRDTKGDGHFDEIKLLLPIDGGGEHGPHAILLGPDKKSLFIVGGNFTHIPEIETSLPPRCWKEDQLLPRMPDAGGHDPHIMAPAGWIGQIDPDGGHFKLRVMGMRNAFDMAFNRDGELFAHDSDMEWDVGTSWYRPTRLCHIMSGVDWGWRNGSGKFMVYNPDTLPPVVDLGPGSPTGATFGYGAKFPAKYQEALYLLDWTNGVIFMVSLQPTGSTYTATFDKFATGTPFPLTDAVIGADGAMYITTGGRHTLSGLYRITYVGAESTAAVAPATPAPGAAERALLHKIEAYHGHSDPAAIEAIWQYLNHADRAVRYAARVAIEHQPVAEWRDRALAETDVESSLGALLALARLGEKSDQPALLKALERIDWSRLDAAQRLALLRVYNLCLARMGEPAGNVRAPLAAKISSYFPSDSSSVNRELSTLMVFLGATDAVPKILKQLANSPIQDEQIHYAKVLRVANSLPWTLDERKAYFTWFQRATEFHGGRSFSGFVNNMKKEAIAALGDSDRAALGALLTDKPDPATLQPPRKVVKEYTIDDLLSKAQNGLTHRNFERGRAMFATAQCAKCHRFNLDGGIGGPDLTSLAGRFSPRDLLESIIEPSKVVSDQYQATIFMVNGKQIIGRITNLHNEKVTITEDLTKPGDGTTVKRDDIDETTPSRLSMMPTGLLNTFSEDEILDLLAYLLSRGDKDNVAFK